MAARGAHPAAPSLGDLPPTQAPVGGMLHWHAQAARSTASTPRMMQCCSSLTQRCSSATE
eukprot:scaffold48498_cov32-Phaeocystis_antarctica.AAC.1